MRKLKKYYVVWHGRRPGIYESWRATEAQVRGFSGAQFKSFRDLLEAQDAFAGDCRDYIGSQGGEPTDFDLSAHRRAGSTKPVTASVEQRLEPIPWLDS